MTRFRDVRARLGPDVHPMVAIEILRNRLTIEPGEGAISVRLAAAPFANYDTKSKAERDSPEEIEKLVNQIELAAEQTVNTRGKSKGGQKGRDSLHLTDAYNTPNDGTRQKCEGCGKVHAGGIAACYANAERVLAEREAYRASKGAKGGKGDGRGGRRRRNGGKGQGEQGQLTQEAQHGQAPANNQSQAQPAAPAQQQHGAPAGGRDHLAEAVAVLLAGRDVIATTVDNGFNLVGGDDGGDSGDDQQRRNKKVPKEKKDKPDRRKQRAKRDHDPKQASRKSRATQSSDSEMTDAESEGEDGDELVSAVAQLSLRRAHDRVREEQLRQQHE